MGDFGDPRSPITISGMADGDQLPVLDGESTRSMGIALVESENVVIENLVFQNYTDEGLLILEGSDFVVRGNHFLDNGRQSYDPDLGGEGFGVAVDGAQEVLIEGNEVHGNGPNQERWEQYILGMGIDTYGNSDVVIRDNHVSGTIGGGILVEDSENVLVENNDIHDNELDANGDYWDGGIWVDGGQNITLRGNTITDNHGPGLNLSDEDVQYPEASKGYVVEDNLVTGNLFGVFVWNFGGCPAPEDAIRFGENQIEGNDDLDMWCEPQW
ncbi:MAG: hypothetical protein MAG431_02465 [Chloroflexi bacterium]|nr:hypothetical protein [Chloroflexota bacterium]